jgi:glycosylphosphatidylinositol transamidase (GPIT) subunit GPI8
MEEDVDGDLADIEALNYDDLDTVSKLQKTQRYNDIMQVIILSIIFTFTAASLHPCWFG